MVVVAGGRVVGVCGRVVVVGGRVVVVVGGLVVVVVGGGTAVVVVLVGGPATAYEVDDTLSDDTSTASKADPATVRRAPRSVSFQPGSGAPLRNQGEPLSASTMPCCLRARSTTWLAAENPLMSNDAFSRNHAPMGGSEAPPVAALWLAGHT